MSRRFFLSDVVYETTDSRQDIQINPGKRCQMSDRAFSFDITVNGRAYGKRFFTLRQGESLDHVILKLTGFILFCRYEPSVEMPVGWKYRPDLVSLDDSGRPALWVECADVAPSKLRRVLQRYTGTNIAVLKITRHDALHFSRNMTREGEKSSHLEILGFDEGFIADFCTLIRDRATIKADVSETDLTVQWDRISLASKIHRFRNAHQCP